MCQHLECSAHLKSCVQRVMDLIVGNHFEVCFEGFEGLEGFELNQRMNQIYNKNYKSYCCYYYYFAITILNGNLRVQD